MAFSFSPKIVTNGLVLALDAANARSYPGSGTTWSDLSKNVNNGSLVNGPTFSSDSNGGITFDGVDDYVNLGPIFNFTSEDFTFSYWIYLNSLSTTTVGQGPVIIFKGSYQVKGYYDQIVTNGKIIFVTNQLGTIQSSETQPIVSALQWYNICHVRNGSSIRIYLNGIDKTFTAGTHSNPTSNTDNFQLIRYGYVSDFIYGNLRLSSFLTYNRALSAQEVLQNYNATKSRFNLT